MKNKFRKIFGEMAKLHSFIPAVSFFSRFLSGAKLRTESYSSISLQAWLSGTRVNTDKSTAEENRDLCNTI